MSAVDPTVDIHMPVRFGGAIAFRVVRALINQDVPTRFFVEAGPDLELTGAIDELLDLIAFDDEEVGRVRLRLRAGVKRNRLMHRGDGDFVYLADPDVLLPATAGLFRTMIEQLDAEPKLGAIGLAYFRHDESHIGAGSMLLRRSDYESIGRIRGAGRYCNCDFILRELGLQEKTAIIFDGEIAHHLRDDPLLKQEPPRSELRADASGELPMIRIHEIVGGEEDGFLVPTFA